LLLRPFRRWDEGWGLFEICDVRSAMCDVGWEIGNRIPESEDRRQEAGGRIKPGRSGFNCEYIEDV
jgi:hypothetical protein